MQYPQLTEYVKAITDAADNFDKLAHLRPVMDNHGEPLRSVGGFAVVFKMQDEDTGRTYAIKCFHEDQSGRDLAYQAISKTLSSVKSPHLIEVNYLEKELFVDTSMSTEKEYPVLQMDWVDGKTMETYIATHYRDGVAIKRLYEKFCDLALWLRTQPFAHGDIKPDNIMISTDGNLVLVDYDGMFVPSLAGSLSPTIGTKGFSHPLRTDKDFNKDIDDFALASMSISLLAMSEDVSLYTDYSAPDRLLLSDEDYKDFYNSKIYRKLTTLGGIFPKLVELFGECLKTNDNNSILYDQIFDLQTKAPEILSFECKTGRSVYEDDVIILSWNIENATQVTINGCDVTGKVKYKCKAKKSQDFELKVSNGLKESTRKISVEVLPLATVSLKSDMVKLRKGKEKKVHLSWKAKNVVSALLRIGTQDISVKPIGNKSIELEKSTDVALVVLGLDGKRFFKKSLRINFFSESEVIFEADKYYSMPNVPVHLSWNILHAKEVELVGSGKVDFVGSEVVKPTETSTYILKVTDAFGTQEHSIKVEMLPLPFVRELKVPTPSFNKDVKINISIPTPNFQIKFPNIEMMGVKLKALFVPSLTELNLDTKLTKRIERQINLWADLKSLYFYYRNKLLSHER